MVMDAFERAQRRAQLARPWLEPGVDDALVLEGSTEVVALGFVDLVGSTAWAQSLGLREQSLALTRFESAAWSSAVLAGGRVVKMIGDEVFFAAPTADAACRIGLEVIEAAAADHVLPSARGAVGIGPAIPREGDYFGPMVNVLSRLVNRHAGELVVTEAVAKALSPDEWSLRPLNPPLCEASRPPYSRFTWSITPQVVERFSCQKDGVNTACLRPYAACREPPPLLGRGVNGRSVDRRLRRWLVLAPVATTKSSVLGLRLDNERRTWVEAIAAEQGVSVHAVFEALMTGRG